MKAKQPSRRSARSGRSRTTMRDIAREAGVSPQTVSRSLRASRLVKPETRQRVEDTARQLGYIPNNAASAFASARSYLIAVLVPNAFNVVFSEIVRMLTVRLNAMGYQTLLGYMDYRKSEEERLVRRLIGWSPDGVVLSGVDHSRHTRRILRDSGIPVVECFDMTVEPIGDVVGLSHKAMGYETTRFLWDQGYRRIAYLGQELERDPRARHRATGYEEAARQLGMLVCIRSIGPQGTFVAGARGLFALLRERSDIDAAIFSSDIPAVGAVLECQKRGWPVPDRIAIAGNGDYEIARSISPRLTTVRLPLDRISKNIVEILSRRIEGDTSPVRTLDVGFRIVPGGSAIRR